VGATPAAAPASPNQAILDEKEKMQKGASPSYSYSQFFSRHQKIKNLREWTLLTGQKNQEPLYREAPRNKGELCLISAGAR
jgi:hypothetical protein